MGVKLRTEFLVSSIILTSFRQVGVTLSPTQKQSSKNATLIRVNSLSNALFVKKCRYDQ